MRVLVVDDQKALRSMIRSILEMSGYEVIEAETGLAALPFVDSVDVVLTDVLMPEYDGIELMRNIHRDNPMMPLIAMSGGGELIPADMSLKFTEVCGAKYSLRKPFSRKELLGVLGKVEDDLRR